MGRRIEVLWCIALAAMSLLPGCTAPHAADGPAHMVCPEGAATAVVVDVAHRVLADMHFPIEKLDAEHGVIRTRPLRAGQFFELWQYDNVGGYNATEANVQSIRRTVELRVRTEAGDLRSEVEGASALQPTASGLHIECNVLVQRLALPSNDVAGVSQAYLMHTRSQRTLQIFEVTPQQREGMAWINLGQDPDLAAEILRRIHRRFRH